MRNLLDFLNLYPTSIRKPTVFFSQAIYLSLAAILRYIDSLKHVYLLPKMLMSSFYLIISYHSVNFINCKHNYSVDMLVFAASISTNIT